MKLVRWNPRAYRPMPMLYEGLAKTMDELFGSSFDRFDLGKFDWEPRVDVEELEDRFEVTAELPGLEKDNMDIEVRDNVLTIKGERKSTEEKNGKRYHVCERTYGSFERSFSLPENVKTDNIEAAYKDGVLKINIPKTEPVKPKEIKIKVH